MNLYRNKTLIGRMMRIHILPAPVVKPMLGQIMLPVKIQGTHIASQVLPDYGEHLLTMICLLCFVHGILFPQRYRTRLSCGRCTRPKAYGRLTISFSQLKYSNNYLAHLTQRKSVELNYKPSKIYECARSYLLTISFIESIKGSWSLGCDMI